MNFFSQQKDAAKRLQFAAALVAAVNMDFEKLYADGNTNALSESVSQALEDGAKETQEAKDRAEAADKAKAKAERQRDSATKARNESLGKISGALESAGIKVSGEDLEDPEKVKEAVEASVNAKSGRKALQITTSRGVAAPVDDEPPVGTAPTGQKSEPVSAYDTWSKQFPRRKVA